MPQPPSLTQVFYIIQEDSMRIAILALAAIGLAASPALAHPDGHDDYRPQRKPIAEVAQEAVVKLVTQAKLPASWAKATPLKSEVRTKGGEQQWVVTFQNNAERNRAKRLLYVILQPDGTFVSANHKLV
jgi:hypothetical protein